MSIAEEIRSFLHTEPVYQGFLPKEISNDLNLIKAGALDSIGIFTLVNFLEKTYGISVNTTDLIDSNFCNLNAIEAFVRSRKR